MTNEIPAIRYLERNEINNDLWDHCISNSPTGLLYARAFYLDFMSPNWSALVLNNYEMVMPLTWKKKFGFAYLYQPYFTKTLGVFGKTKVPFEISGFLQAIPDKFKYWDIDINDNNFLAKEKTTLNISIYNRCNYLLPLKDEYHLIKSRYRRLANRMIKKAIAVNTTVFPGVDPAFIIDLYRKDYRSRHRSITKAWYGKLTMCLEFALHQDMAETYLAKSPSGEIMSYYIILKDDRFIYSLLGGSTDLGKKNGSFYMLTDTVIHKHAGSDKIFRFEGSDIPGISFFNGLFRAQKTEYPHLVCNKLPIPFRYFK